MERSETIAFRMLELFESSPYDESLTMRLSVEHILRIADDNHRRTKGKRKTFAMYNSKGKPVPDATRNKQVAALIGQLISLEPRQTRPWVMDLLEDAMTYWPWQVKRDAAAA
jgi:hypothetical protein